MLYVISGPSGCGKSTLIRRIIREMRSVRFSVSHTTRQKRTNEVNGKDYHFVTKEDFERMIKDEVFMEWAVVHGFYYGTAKSELEPRAGGEDVLLDIDVQGAKQLRERLQGAAFIFVVPSSIEELRRRLEIRGENTPETILARLEVARQEVNHYEEFDFIVLNDRLEQAVGELKAIIQCGQCCLETRRADIEPILKSFNPEDSK